MAGIDEEDLQGTHYRELKPYSKVPSSRGVVALMLLPLLLSLQPRPQQHNSDNHTTTTAPQHAIVTEIVISTVVIIILPLALLELTRLIFLMVPFVLSCDCSQSRKNDKEGNNKDCADLSPAKPERGRKVS